MWHRRRDQTTILLNRWFWKRNNIIASPLSLSFWLFYLFSFSFFDSAGRKTGFSIWQFVLRLKSWHQLPPKIKFRLTCLMRGFVPSQHLSGDMQLSAPSSCLSPLISGATGWLPIAGLVRKLGVLRVGHFYQIWEFSRVSTARPCLSPAGLIRRGGGDTLISPDNNLTPSEVMLTLQ